MADYAEGARRYGAREFRRVRADAARTAAYRPICRCHLALCASAAVRDAMHLLAGEAGCPSPPERAGRCTSNDSA